MVNNEFEKFEKEVQSMTEKGYSAAGLYGMFESSFKQDNKGMNLYETIIKHPLIRACNKIKVRTIMRTDQFIVKNKTTPRNSVNNIKAFWESRPDLFIPKMLWQLAQTNSYYGEIVKDGNGKITDLATRDAKNMEHLLDGKGNLRGYVQVLANEYDATKKYISRDRVGIMSDNKIFTDNKAIYYKLDEILYVSTDHLDSSSFAHSELLSLEEALDSIDMIHNFIRWLFKSNQFRTAIRIPTGMSDSEYKRYLNDLFQSLKNPERFLLLRGDAIQHAPLRKIEGFDELLNLLDYYRSQVLALLQITPIQVSLTNDSNRSSSDTQYRYVNYDDIRATQKLISKSFEFDLFPRIGLGNSNYIWSPLDMKEYKENVELAQMFLGMNANVKKVNTWLQERGVDIPDNFLEKPIVNEVEKVELDKNSTLHPSRKPQEKELEDMGRK